MEKGNQETAVLISIRPEWCEKIISGEKTIEARKTKPKIKPPFKCYIYCTQPKYEHQDYFVLNAGTENAFSFYGGGKVIGEFICDTIVWVVAHPSIFAGHDLLYAKAIEDACLTQEQAEKYASGKDVYGWHISDLRIYEEPLALKEFSVSSTMPCNSGSMKTFTKQLQDPPRSWCYVDERR